MDRIWLPEDAQDGILVGKRILIPRHVREMTPTDRKFWMLERSIKPFFKATSFAGVEALAWMEQAPVAVGPNNTLLSVLSRECLQLINSTYLNHQGKRLWVRAYGIISTTATVPTFQLQFLTGPTIANPLTAGQMLGQNAAITPAASTTGNLEWWLDIFIRAVVTGPSGSLLCIGTLVNDWAAAGTYVITPFKNATPPTAVVLTGTGGLAASLYFDLEIIMSAATAGNSITCMDYQLLSKN